MLPNRATHHICEYGSEDLKSKFEQATARTDTMLLLLLS